MRSDAVQHFQELFFSKDLLPNGSVSEYYKQVSNNNIDLTGEVVGPVRLPHKLSYYANGNSGMNSSPPNAQSFAADALSAVDGLINFNPYDNDGNGYVDAFIVIHAGQGAEESASRNDLWSLKWVLPQQARVDNVNIYAFLTVPEDAYIGVCAHEIGHLVFGWPDLYDIDQSSEGIGDWCLMAGGSWGGTPPGVRPCHPSAWCKSSQGWIRLEAPQRKQQLSLGAVEQDDVVYRLWSKGDTSSKEYFLLENREPIDYDTSLPGFGLLGQNHFSCLSSHDLC
jgi:immune inhibitor A